MVISSTSNVGIHKSENVKTKMAEKIETESHLRSILKGLTWRILATATTVTIAYFIIGDVSSALTIGGIEFFGKLLLYYFHERAWQMVPRGSVRRLVSKIKK